MGSPLLRSRQQNIISSYLSLTKLLLLIAVFASLNNILLPTTSAAAFVANNPYGSKQLCNTINRVSSQRLNTRNSLATTSLSMVAKTGGKIIKSIEEFSGVVLAPNVPRPVLAFFTAPWCGPCRLTTPVVKEILKQFSGEVDVVEICTDDLAEVASECGVMSVPTIQFYYGGELYETIIGCVARGVLAGAVTRVLEDVKEKEKVK